MDAFYFIREGWGKMGFANFQKAFKKPESVISITKEQMKLFTGEDPEVKLYIVEIKEDGMPGKKIPIRPIEEKDLYADNDV